MKDCKQALHTIMEKLKMLDESVESVTNNLIYCSFCGKNSDFVRKMVGGRHAYICDECVDICAEICEEANEEVVPEK